MIGEYSDRHFQLWEYSVSHGSLLVRSPRGPEFDTNVDLAFVGVEYVGLPRHLRGVELHRGIPEDVALAGTIIDRVDPAQVFALVSGNRRHLVVAAACQVSENQKDLFEIPFPS